MMHYDQRVFAITLYSVFKDDPNCTVKYDRVLGSGTWWVDGHRCTESEAVASMQAEMQLSIYQMLMGPSHERTAAAVQREEIERRELGHHV